MDIDTLGPVKVDKASLVLVLFNPFTECLHFRLRWIHRYPMMNKIITKIVVEVVIVIITPSVWLKAIRMLY